MNRTMDLDIGPVCEFGENIDESIIPRSFDASHLVLDSDPYLWLDQFRDLRWYFDQ